MNFSCRVNSFLVNPDLISAVIEILILAGVVCFFIIFVKRLFRFTKGLIKRSLGTVFLLILSLLIFFVSSTIFWRILLSTTNIYNFVPPSAGNHVLNAAIKNTCFLDPQKIHCPKSAEEVIEIDPKNFSELTKDLVLTYRYYPETGGYTLIVRNKNISHDNFKVAIFDPRLKDLKYYGTGVDFVDTGISFCNGKYTLIYPPPFPGPWDSIN